MTTGTEVVASLFGRKKELTQDMLRVVYRVDLKRVSSLSCSNSSREGKIFGKVDIAFVCYTDADVSAGFF